MKKCIFKLLHVIHVFTSHGVHNIIIYNISFAFKISLFLLGFMNKFYDLNL